MIEHGRDKQLWLFNSKLFWQSHKILTRYKWQLFTSKLRLSTKIASRYNIQDLSNNVHALFRVSNNKHKLNDFSTRFAERLATSSLLTVNRPPSHYKEKRWKHFSLTLSQTHKNQNGTWKVDKAKKLSIAGPWNVRHDWKHYEKVRHWKSEERNGQFSH